MEESADKKKTYETPELVTYGDVRILTASVANLGSKSDHLGGNIKTS
jgi:hypothetical protein